MGRASNAKWTKRAARCRGLVMKGRRRQADELSARMNQRRPVRWARALAAGR